MNLGLSLRRDRQLIRQQGFAAYQGGTVTYYVGPKGSRKLERQKLALQGLKHLEVAPEASNAVSFRGFSCIPAEHQPAHEFAASFSNSERQGRIELVRRLGAALGMVHSLKSLKVGAIDQTFSGSQAQLLKGMLVRGAFESRQRIPRGLMEHIQELWPSEGASLVVGWQGWPKLMVAEDALLILDFSQAQYFEPLWDFVRLEPCALEMGIAFWDYFLQGYCATGELEVNWREKVEVLYQVAQFSASFTSSCQDLICHYQSRWWDTL